MIEKKPMTVGQFCRLMDMTNQNWTKLSNGQNRTTSLTNIWRFAVLLGLDRWETCDLLRLAGKLDMALWEERDQAVWACLGVGPRTPAEVEAALRIRDLPPLYTEEGRNMLNIPTE